MSTVTQKIMMRKTKATLISMLEEQRQMVREANADRDSWKATAEVKRKFADTWKDKCIEIGSKHEKLEFRFNTLNVVLDKKDLEISQLKNAYLDKLELLVEMYEKHT